MDKKEQILEFDMNIPLSPSYPDLFDSPSNQLDSKSIATESEDILELEPTTPNCFRYKISTSTFVNIEIVIPEPYFKFVPLEFEVPEIKRGKITGNIVWKFGTPRLIAEKLKETFPSMLYFVHLDLFAINYKGYLRTLHPLLLQQYILQQTQNIPNMDDKVPGKAVNILKMNCATTAMPAHTAGAIPFDNIIMEKLENLPYAFIKWHNITYIENIPACPTIFMNFITKLFPDEIERDKCLAYMCYLLYESKAIQQNLWIVGEPHDGKSQLLDFIGKTIISFKNADMEQVMKDRASEAAIRNVHVLIFDEVGNVKMDKVFVEKIKRWAIQKSLTVRGGYEKTALETPFYGRILLASNILPLNNYLDKAFYERHTILHSKKSYDGGMIADFADKLLEEKDAIWSWIYDTYHTRMLEILQIRSNLTERDYMKNIDPYYKFIQKCEISEDFITATDIYDFYKKFAGDKTVGSSEFFRRLNHQDGFEKERIYLNGIRKTVYYIHFVDEPQPYYQCSDEKLEELERKYKEN
jgi:hypothetical protein